MASSIKVSSASPRSKYHREGSVSRPKSYDRLQAAAGRECEDRAEELADWLGQFDNGVYTDEPEALSIARKF